MFWAVLTQVAWVVPALIHVESTASMRFEGCLKKCLDLFLLGTMFRNFLKVIQLPPNVSRQVLELCAQHLAQFDMVNLPTARGHPVLGPRGRTPPARCVAVTP